MSLQASDESTQGTYAVLVEEVDTSDNSNRNARTYSITVNNVCHLLTMTSLPLPDVSYQTGDPELTISIPDFTVSPTYDASICPSIVHEYYHATISGALTATLVYETKSIKV